MNKKPIEIMSDDEATELDWFLLDAFSRMLFGDCYEMSHDKEQTKIIPISKEEKKAV